MADGAPGSELHCGNGPVTQQDRWEEDGGYSPFTLAAEISALLAAADIAQALTGHSERRRFSREVADAWNDNIERWTYAAGERSRAANRRGRLLRAHRAARRRRSRFAPAGICSIKNRASSTAPAVEIVSPDALALVRFGLRAPDDPRMLNTIKVIDELLRVKLPRGPGWYRYNCDGYGEHAGRVSVRRQWHWPSLAALGG